MSQSIPEGVILSKDEIHKRIEALSQPGSKCFFYLGASSALGGPLLRGAGVIEFNPNYPGKKQKKYIIYTSDVEGMELKNKLSKIFDSDNAKFVANWIKERNMDLTTIYK